MIAFLLTPVYAFADRWIGWGGDAQHRKTIGMLVSLLGAAVVAFVLHAWRIEVLGIAWVVTRRMLPFKPPFGTITVRNPGDGLQTFIRWMIPALAAGALAVNAGQPITTAWPLAAYAVLSTLLAVILGALTKPGTPPLGYDPNAYVEAVRGALFGLAMAVWAGSL